MHAPPRKKEKKKPPWSLQQCTANCNTISLGGGGGCQLCQKIILWFQAAWHLHIHHNIMVPGIIVISLSELDFDPWHPNKHIPRRKSVYDSLGGRRWTYHTAATSKNIPQMMGMIKLKAPLSACGYLPLQSLPSFVTNPKYLLVLNITTRISLVPTFLVRWHGEIQWNTPE